MQGYSSRVQEKDLSLVMLVFCNIECYRKHAALYLPTTMSSRSVACGLIRVQMSMVNKVLLLLKMEAKEDMRAASITASIRPRKPGQKHDRKQSRGHVRQK